ncbi:MAG: hypothetical protein HZB38_18310 [Planctomycetes bacterium]|nr:hypothetical protein [Planctomycetota bacterium]
MCAVILGSVGALAADPWADRVVSYDPGQAQAAGYGNPMVSLGSPERFTGESDYPSAVTMFSPPFGGDEIVQIDRGGALVVAFDEPIVDDPVHPYGVDLIVFGNGGFMDDDFPNGRISSSGDMFGVDPMRVSVSADGVYFTSLGIFNEGFVPTQGYRDVGPFSGTPGIDPTDFTVPVDPSLTVADFAGLEYAQALALYGKSGGGTPIDLHSSGLESIQYVKIEPVNELPGDVSVEIDAFATVPEPNSCLGGLLLSLTALRRTRRS